MRRITFIAPVDAIQGNLSGKQDLRYALNNNKAFESPAGQKNYAKNYQTRYIGARRASDGLKYFTVKTKSATNTTQAALQAMALLGGAGAIYAAIIKNKASQLYEHAVAAYEYRGPEHADESMREYLMDIIRRGLAAKQSVISLASQVSINNPWAASPTGNTDTVVISNKTIAKFFYILGVDIIKFTVDGEPWAAWSGKNWGQFANDQKESYGKGVQLVSVEGSTYVQTKGKFIVAGVTYQTGTDVIESGEAYTTTSVQPGE